jgi:hypothetical protein
MQIRQYPRSYGKNKAIIDAANLEARLKNLKPAFIAGDWNADAIRAYADTLSWPRGYDIIEGGEKCRS